MSFDGEHQKDGSYRDLIAWQRAMDLADAVYDVTANWPSKEQFRLSDQILRAAISIPSNIAEGQGRGSLGDFGRFLTIAHGSLCELETQLTMAKRRGYIDRAFHDKLLSQSAEVGRVIRGLFRKVRSRSPRAFHEDGTPYDLHLPIDDDLA